MATTTHDLYDGTLLETQGKYDDPLNNRLIAEYGEPENIQTQAEQPKDPASAEPEK